AQVGGERLAVVIAPGGDFDTAIRTLSPHAQGDLYSDPERRRIVVPVANGARLLATIVRELDAAGIQPPDLALRRPTLGGVFLALTGHAAEESPNEEPQTGGPTEQEEKVRA